eukprot:CAMPEP_0181174658 /NCGR_PEP_ID=MMETSP1096-20121128/3660_1 /TAXON_ID=156174 ORGANISM="Chrysochromulina ericina, Strain CCMP281" /NCGR_SAMPLE_ID=MMETSP1096 /ASSEMBLY_ACC=CAM_ASM_000453 /LENGTH=168 /DNA_ID=CAMNT_0023262587 /DNA_START=72 /DNA_END=578 /DNA_ORIENTATION=+
MAFLEMSVHLHAVHFNPLAKALLHLFSTVCICANIFVVSIITFVSVWGSGKALRGKDGSMSVVVEGMKKESRLIFYTFGIGLLSLLVAVACSTWLLMQREVALLATVMLLATCYALISNAIRIFKKFELQSSEVVRFNDFLRALPKAEENIDEEEFDEDNDDPSRAIV